MNNLHQAGFLLLRLKPQQKAVEQFRLLNEKIQDLTKEIRQRMETEADLRQSEALFRELADAMPQIVWTARPDGILDYFNRRWYELTGRQKATAASDEDWLPVLHPDDRQRCLDTWHECVRTGRHYQIEYRFKFPHETGYRWHLGRALAVRDENGKIIRWFGTCTDIDDQKMAAEKLEKAVSERTSSLQRAFSQLEEFSYSVSHDLRAPLRAMQGYANALLSDYRAHLDDTGREYLERIVRAAERMDKLILDVLTFSRIARTDFQLQSVSLNKLVHEIVEHYPALQFPAAQIQIGDIPPVHGHEPSLTQAVSNLLMNAVKFVPEGVQSRVVVRSELHGQNVRIWFEDNGIGIDPEHQKKIFGLFERVHPEKKYPGTGVGLAVVRKAVERMGGQVGVISDGASGSRFWIELQGANSIYE